VYLGTPHQGSESADLKKIILNIYSTFATSSLEIVRDVKPAADFLHLQQQLYQSIASNYFTCFCYETLDTRVPGGLSTRVVPQASAVIWGIPDTLHIPINADHIRISKYSSATEDGYLALTAVLQVMSDTARDRFERRWKAYTGWRSQQCPNVQ
jgi:hypothetical protein